MNSTPLRIFLSALLLASFLGGCGADGDGPASLDQVDLNEVALNPGTTWIRSTGSGATAVTDVLVVQADDPTALPEEYRRVIQATLTYDGAAEIQLGVIGSDGEGGGAGEIAFHHRWSFVPEPMLSILQRAGATREDIDPVLIEPLTFAANGNQLDVTIGSETKTYSSLIRMIGDIDATIGFDTQAGAEAAAQLMKLPMLTSQPRIEGFGSGGMTQYMDNPATFAGMVPSDVGPSTLTVEVTGGLTMPETTFSFDDFQDQDGIVLDGDQVTLVNIQGNGDLSGEVSFVFRTDLDDPLQTVSGSVDFNGLTVTDGFGSGGTATMMLEGSPFMIDGDLLLYPDYSAYLPVL